MTLPCRSRLVEVVVAEAICSRPYDEAVPPNQHINSMHEYCVDKGRGFSSFRRGDALEVIR